MKIYTHPIPLSKPASTERLVKRSALTAFRALRAMGRQASQVPGVLLQAQSDIRSAWQDSARPNA